MVFLLYLESDGFLLLALGAIRGQIFLLERGAIIAA